MKKGKRPAFSLASHGKLINLIKSDTKSKRFQQIVRESALTAPVQKVERFAKGQEDSHLIPFHHSIKVPGPLARDLRSSANRALLRDSIGADAAEDDEQCDNRSAQPSHRSHRPSLAALFPHDLPIPWLYTKHA